ncbi:nucleoside triphosphate pyrophosphohydrolase [Marinobacterium aestuarii]|uniref:Nucleoside triphosphate pyrophosphohydrolase n=1 Tax=Marinobacterium aestuarii TaxID=1821621 RepID=A0A1A9F140_9GAMM|nr:nucleoside triphosphate pyrophosphohydrolase [Marinobacterium aestuarii]ANG64054.1 nucleoside triphosphate pyrophosphohydrolase [Marinobacterium aestuarii]
MAEYDLDDLLCLMARLRDPADGCPWDLKQDFASIVRHTLEEAYEVADTIERQDWPHLKDELGDLLFQVVFYARLGEESGRFDFADIVDNLVRKLLRRHPHVFPAGTLGSRAGDMQRSEQQVSETWELIKQEEREGKASLGVLDDIPAALPGLSRALKLQKRASGVGFDWNDPLLVLDKIEEEIGELREAIRRGKQDEITDEMGDLLFAQVNLARHLGVDPETAVRSTNAKFVRRFGYIESVVTASGRDWDSFSLDELDGFWNQAKKLGL